VNVVEVMAHEIFVLLNVDIPLTLANGLLKGTEMSRKLKILAEESSFNKALEEDENEELFKLLVGFDSEKQLDFCKEIVSEVNRVTGKDIKYCLWLCDSKNDVRNYLFQQNTKVSDDDIAEYEKSDVILSDLFDWEGKLYGYEEYSMHRY
jgi:hypothetical protein